MTATVKELEQRLRREAAPLFYQTGPSASSGQAGERIPPGFVGNEETEELREKLRELLPSSSQGDYAAASGAIANELDRRAAQQLIDVDRRFTIAEAEFVEDLWGSYQTRNATKAQGHEE